MYTQNNKELIAFCQNVKKLRERNGLSKKEMAKILGIGISSLTKIEKGIIPPRTRADVVFKVLFHFKIKSHELFTEL